MKSLTCAMLNEMDNWKWYTNKYLAEHFWWRFWGRLHNLRKMWVKFEKEKGQGYIESWRVVSIPKNVIYKNRTKIKVIRISLLDKIYNLIFW